MKISRIIFIIIAVLAVSILLYVFLFKNNNKIGGQKHNLPASAQNNALALAPEVNNKGGVSIEARPIDLRAGKRVKFEIAITAHQGDLDFDLAKISVLVDSWGRQYSPLEWQGGRGGHHLSGTLIFSPLEEETKHIKLIVKNIYGTGERIFEWDLE